MDTLLGVARELLLFALVVAVLLGPVHAFLRFRLRRAQARPGGFLYVPLADRWIPAVLFLSGAGLLAFLTAIR